MINPTPLNIPLERMNPELQVIKLAFWAMFAFIVIIFLAQCLL